MLWLGCFKRRREIACKTGIDGSQRREPTVQQPSRIAGNHRICIHTQKRPRGAVRRVVTVVQERFAANTQQFGGAQFIIRKTVLTAWLAHHVYSHTDQRLAIDLAETERPVATRQALQTTADQWPHRCSSAQLRGTWVACARFPSMSTTAAAMTNKASISPSLRSRGAKS